MFFTPSRSILLSHIERLRAIVSLKSKNDKENARFFEAELNKLAKRHIVLSRIRITAFVLLYASVVSTVLSGLPILGELAQTATALGGLFGVGFLGLIALWLTWRLNQVWNRMMMIYGHLVAIYEKNNKGFYHLEDLPNENVKA